MTKDVLQERYNLQSIIHNLQPQVDAGLGKLHELRTEWQVLEQHKTEVEGNKDFEYEVEETRQIQKELPKGQNVTNCLHCHVTCHDNCRYADDEEKAKCSAMGFDGNCKVCSSKCSWKQHKNTPYIFEFVTEKVKKTYQEKLAKYEKATGEKLTHEKLIEKMTQELDDLTYQIQYMMAEVNDCNNRLKQIALRPDPLSMTDHIDLMIEAEKQEKRVGYEGRIRMLNNIRQKADIDKTVEKFQEEMKHAQGLVQKGGAKGPKRNVLQKVGNFFGNLFS